MTALRIAERLGEDFLAQALPHDYRHIPGAIYPTGLLTWDDLNRTWPTTACSPRGCV
ncbi:hypothetical protein [Streptomyces telluris]|uniref:Uncharacterized protein n=1 Tax=Streptomyces telluris TaxID=2720021 RepID=A0A9X2LPD3_9ACTN|nr:hypothetical protein [Streptomyces telluris]